MWKIFHVKFGLKFISNLLSDYTLGFLELLFVKTFSSCHWPSRSFPRSTHFRIIENTFLRSGPLLDYRLRAKFSFKMVNLCVRFLMVYFNGLIWHHSFNYTRRVSKLTFFALKIGSLVLIFVKNGAGKGTLLKCQFILNNLLSAYQLWQFL